MSKHRGVRALLAVVVLLWAAPAALAQGDQATAVLTLDRQTPWNTLQDPSLRVRVRAQNLGGATLNDLSIALTIGTEVRTRGTYDASLTSGPVTAYFHEFPVQGSLAPGQTKTFGFSLDLSALSSTVISHTESLIYPTLIQLRSAGQLTGGELRTPILFLVRQPVQPLELSWALDLAPPPAIGPDGRLVDPALAVRLAPGGDLRAEIDALTLLSLGSDPSPVDVAISPRFVDELRQMAGGSAGGDAATAVDAAHALEAIVALVHSDAAQVSAYPYSAPNLPALLRGGLAGDVATQTDLGDRIFEEVLGSPPSAVAQGAPGGALDTATLDQLATGGASVVLGQAESILRPPDPNYLTLQPTGLVAASESDLPIVLPDTGLQAMLTSDMAADPVLAAQTLLGALASVWQEAPSPGFPRGVAISTAGLELPAEFWGAFARHVAHAPFLQPVLAARLVQDVPPPTPAAPLAAPSVAGFSHEYVKGIKLERVRVEDLRSMLIDPGVLPERLDVSLLVAESGAFVGDETAGRRWIDGVNSATGAVFLAATPRTEQRFTLTSTSGTIPIRLGDPGGLRLHVQIQLSSSKLRFPQGNIRDVTLTEPNQIVTFPVETTSTGQITVQVKVKAPSGHVVTETNLIVRSTAYNRVALLVTIAAALGLVLLWARRFLRRRTP
ncbi:MAG: hypothetical protein HY240_00225 [Actinobacteria bacterium]|nr:hypothetical protein [Actinomycetota bacterium]